MKAVDFDEIQINDKILIDLKDRSGDHNYTILEVCEVDEGDHSIVSNLNGGMNIYPNEDDQYIVVEYDGED